MLRYMPAELHVAKPANPGETVSDAAKLLTKATPGSGTPPADPDKDVPEKNPKSAVDANWLL